MWTFYDGAFVSEPLGPKQLRVVVRPEWSEPPAEGAEWLALMYGPTWPLNYVAMGSHLVGWGSSVEQAITAAERALERIPLT